MVGRVMAWCVLVLGALVAIPASAVAQAPAENEFEVTTLAKGADKTGEPIAMAVLPDRRVLHTSRDGRVWLTTPNATTSLAGTIPVYSHDEDGLQGIAIDADFATNRWVYVYYAPPLTTPHGRRARQRRRPGGLRGLQGLQPARAHQARPKPARSTSRPSRRSSRCPPTAASAAMPAARSTSTPRATSTSRPATTRTRSRRTATRRSTSARRATRASTRSAARPTRTTCAASCCGSRSRRTARTRCPTGNLFPEASDPGDKTRPRSTRWASATRSGSRSTARRAGSTSATTAPTRAAPTRTAGRAARSSST